MFSPLHLPCLPFHQHPSSSNLTAASLHLSTHLQPVLSSSLPTASINFIPLVHFSLPTASPLHLTLSRASLISDLHLLPQHLASVPGRLREAEAERAVEEIGGRDERSVCCVCGYCQQDHALSRQGMRTV